jgi:hypothetical protein
MSMEGESARRPPDDRGRPDLQPGASSPARFGEVRFASRRDTPPLQAADLLAYESYKHVVNAFSGFRRPQRRSLARLKSRIVYAEPLPTGLLEKLGVEMESYCNFLNAIGIPRSRIDTL